MARGGGGIPGFHGSTALILLALALGSCESNMNQGSASVQSRARGGATLPAAASHSLASCFPLDPTTTLATELDRHHLPTWDARLRRRVLKKVKDKEKMKYLGENTSKAGSVLVGDVDVYNIWYGDWDRNDPAVATLNMIANELGDSLWYGITRRYYYAKTGDITKRKYVTGKLSLAGSVFISASEGPLNTQDDFVGHIISKVGSKELPMRTVYRPTSVAPAAVYMFISNHNVSASGDVNGGRMCYDACGWHSFARSEKKDKSGKYPHLLFGHVGSPRQCDSIYESTCYIDDVSKVLKGKLPNGRVVDSMVSIYAHELVEVVATPYTDSWVLEKKNGVREENADICQWTFGDKWQKDPKSKALYNTVVGGKPFVIQRNYNPDTGKCAMSAGKPAGTVDHEDEIDKGGSGSTVDKSKLKKKEEKKKG